MVDIRSLRPFDAETIVASVRRTHRLVVVHEAAPFCGIASEIAATVQERAFDWLDAPIARVTGADSPIAYSKPLEDAQLPGPANVVEAVRKTLAGNFRR